jgi:hypothetical protein
MQSTIKELILLKLWKIYVILKHWSRRIMRNTKHLKDFVRELADEAKKELEQDIKTSRGQK